MKYWTILFCAMALVGITSRVPAQETAEPVYGLPYMARFDRLPVLKNAVCKQVSSWDRTGGNGDLGHFLNGDAGKLPGDIGVLADLKGPGCVYRIWSANATGFLRMYFDGEKEPRIACPMQDLFEDRHLPFRPPLAGKSSGGWYSYFPIPYAKSLRIEVEKPGSMYYQVQYHEYPAGTNVRTFTHELTSEDRRALGTIQKQWKNAGQQPDVFSQPGTTTTGEAELKPGQKINLLDQKTAGIVRMLRVHVEPATRFTLRRLALKAYWDGSKLEAVSAPVGDFFGSGFGQVNFASMPLAMSEKGYVCYFPMPFQKSGRIELLNEDLKPVKVSWGVEVGPLPDVDRGNLAYFHAKWGRVTTDSGRHVTLLETAGRGHFVGVNLNMQGDHGLWFLEGDEKIYVDGEGKPSIYGTGLEDYFTAGWYFNTGPFALPYHGAIVKDDPNSRIAAYRYQIADCVPFTRSLKVDIEHGGTNDYPGADYTFTSYWYLNDRDNGWNHLLPVAQRRPASIRRNDVIEIESLPVQGGEKIDDETFPQEMSSGGGILLKNAAGTDRFTAKLNVPEDGHYAFSVGLLRVSDGGTVEVQMDGKTIGEVSARTGGVSRAGVRIGPTDSLTKGEHAVTFILRPPPVAGASERAIIDYLEIRRQLYPGSLEAEELEIRDPHPWGQPIDIQDMKVFGPRWSGGAHVWFRPSEPKHYFELVVPVKEAGTFTLTAYFTKAVDYGQVQVSVGGKNIGPAFDGYNDGVIPSGPVVLGTVDLTPGRHPIRFEVVGKNGKSTGYMVGVDALSLVKK